MIDHPNRPLCRPAASRQPGRPFPSARRPQSCSSSLRPERRHFFGSVGLPPALAYLTIAAEVLRRHRADPRRSGPAIVAIAADTDFAWAPSSTVHGGAGFFFNNATWRLGISGVLDHRIDRPGPARRRHLCAARVAQRGPLRQTSPAHTHVERGGGAGMPAPHPPEEVS